MGPNKAVHVMFMAGGIILYFLLYKTADWVVGYFVRHPSDLLLEGLSAAVALVVGVGAYRNERLNTLANEIATELKKVSWPTFKETKAATLVVIVTVLVAAVLLGTFDGIWAFVTDRIYG